ncbi:uncharacterized protein [Cicer arietinum]|uniref:uncharacterized protein n=1 Tax=Cicer arietinum TaxID=3827 RepID=UPI003CC6123C
MTDTLYWQGMMERVKDFVKACDTCQHQKYVATTPSGLLQSLPISILVWSEIYMNFITCLPKSNGFEAILMVVDHLSKYSHFIPLKHLFTVLSIAAIFVKDVIKLHGILESILRDRDPLFVSTFWEKVVQARFSLFEVVYGMRPPVLVHFLEGETKVKIVARKLRDKDEALRQLKANLLKAQEYMKYQAVKKCKAVQFEIGQVAYKLHLPVTSNIHPTFHTSLLKKVVGNYTATTQLSISLESDTGGIIPTKVLSWMD